jgi:hypothetical protein
MARGVIPEWASPAFLEAVRNERGLTEIRAEQAKEYAEPFGLDDSNYWDVPIPEGEYLSWGDIRAFRDLLEKTSPSDEDIESIRSEMNHFGQAATYHLGKLTKVLRAR